MVFFQTLTNTYHVFILSAHSRFCFTPKVLRTSDHTYIAHQITTSRQLGMNFKVCNPIPPITYCSHTRARTAARPQHWGSRAQSKQYLTGLGRHPPPINYMYITNLRFLGCTKLKPSEVLNSWTTALP